MKVPAIRIHEVDGIRGWAALVVLLYHTFGEMLKFAVPNVKSFWVAPFLASHIAVLVFFVLSGDALSNGFFSGGGFKSVDRLLVRRYFRLTVPIFLSCLITYLIMVLGFDFHSQASSVLNISGWLSKFLQFHASLYSFLRYAFVDVYVSHTPETAYNPFLWTMSVEMIGSMLVFLLCYIWGRLKNAGLVCVALILFSTCIGTYFSLFFAGVFLGYLRKLGYLKVLRDKKNYQLACSAVLLALFVYLMWSTSGQVNMNFMPIKIVVAMILVFCFYTHDGSKTFFNNRVSQFLGEISFPVYLLHFQVLISLMSWLVIQDFARSQGLNQSHLLIIGWVSVIVTLLAATCFRIVEKLVLKKIDFYVLRILSDG
ncbi:peptidoglycan/LPS O-acetylase OafA/YrhL [Oxalobacteraceae bacterium GrIS 2.11]